jgi:hypothetical protein
MDSYGVVPIWDHQLSTTGLLVYLVLIFLGLLLVNKLTEGTPAKYRVFNVFMYGIAIVLCITWMFMALGLWFYVKA